MSECVWCVAGAKFPFVMKLCFSSSRQIGAAKGKAEARALDNGLPDDY
jgi:hypothetical protein